MTSINAERDAHGLDFIGIQMRNAHACTLVQQERERQLVKWGDQSHPMGGSAAEYALMATAYRTLCDDAAEHGEETWVHILLEEVYEAAAEDDLDAFEGEIVQVAAVCLSILEDIKRKRDAEA